MKPSELNQILKEVVAEELNLSEGSRICSWCKKDMGQAQTELDSHGICPNCEKTFNDEFEQMKQNPDSKLMSRQSKLEALKKRRDPDGIEEVNYTQTSSGQSVMAQGAPGSVVRFTTENPEVIKQMRDWAADCQWKDNEDIPDMNDEEILRGVQRHYEGGIRAFIRDSDSKAEVPVGYKEGYGMGDMSKDPKKAFKGARWTVKFETITESEVRSIIKDIINEMWADIGNTSGDTGKEGPTGRVTEPGSDKNLVDLYKGGKPDSTAGLPSVGGGMSETIWPMPDVPMKQYDTVKEWERDNLDGLHKYKGEPLKNYGFLYKVGDIVPPGEYNRSNAMHLWNIAKKTQQDNIALGKPIGYQEVAKPLYEAKGSNTKDKLRSMLKESVHEVLKEYSEQEERQLINSIASIARTAVSRTSEMAPQEALKHFKEIDRMAEKLVKFHSQESDAGYDVPISGLKGKAFVPKNEPKSALGVTQETIARTKTVLEMMLFQKRKK